jgi:hypothetical protein
MAEGVMGAGKEGGMGVTAVSRPQPTNTPKTIKITHRSFMLIGNRVSVNSHQSLKPITVY